MRKKKTNARIPLTFSFESEKLDYNQRCITHNKWFFVISGYFWYGVLEGKRVSYILVTVFFPKFHLKFTLTNSVTNTNRLDSNAHLGLFSNGWIRFKVRSKYQCFKKWKHRGYVLPILTSTHGARAITPTRVLIHFYKFTDRWIKFKWFSFFKTCTSWFLLEFYDFRFV